MTTDDILLEAFERIDLTVDSSIVEDLRRFLEGSSRHEALRLQSSAGDTLKDLASRRGLSFADLYGTQVAALQLAILITQLAERDDLTWAEGLGVASVDDDDLTPGGGQFSSMTSSLSTTCCSRKSVSPGSRIFAYGFIHTNRTADI